MKLGTRAVRPSLLQAHALDGVVPAEPHVGLRDGANVIRRPVFKFDTREEADSSHAARTAAAAARLSRQTEGLATDQLCQPVRGGWVSSCLVKMLFLLSACLAFSLAILTCSCRSASSSIRAVTTSSCSDSALHATSPPQRRGGLPHTAPCMGYSCMRRLRLTDHQLTIMLGHLPACLPQVPPTTYLPALEVEVECGALRQARGQLLLLALCTRTDTQSPTCVTSIE